MDVVLLEKKKKNYKLRQREIFPSGFKVYKTLTAWLKKKTN